MTALAPGSVATDHQHYALQTIFSFFLGLMVLAFIGVGVNTFYPSPAEQHEQQLQELQRQRDRPLPMRPRTGATSAVQALHQISESAHRLRPHANMRSKLLPAGGPSATESGTGTIAPPR